jgi:phosphatidylglycerophosphate synthase
MLDRFVQRNLAPVLQAVGRALVRAGWGADALTLVGFALGMAAAVAIANHAFGLGLVLLLLSRLMDGLDGTVARLTRPTDAGGFLDIVLDFLFYAAVPLAFAWADPVANALPVSWARAAAFWRLRCWLKKGNGAKRRCPAKAFTFWVA